MAKTPITYNGTNTDDLFVAGWKNGKNIKLKVKEINCHNGIVTDGFGYSTDEYSSFIDLSNNINNLDENTIYIVKENDTLSRYLYFEGRLIPLDSNTLISAGLNYGESYKTFNDLYNNKNNLKENTIYSVNDKGTIEQYIFKNSKLSQIGNNINEIIEGSENNSEEVSEIEPIENGCLNYNLLELVNGNYRYKNHTELNVVISDMPALESAIQMFYGTGLTTFCGTLASLKNGKDMFTGCNLDENSLINIIDSIPNHKDSSEIHTLTLSYNSSIEDEIIASLDNEAKLKNWNIDWIKY